MAFDGSLYGATAAVTSRSTPAHVQVLPARSSSRAYDPAARACRR